MSKEPAHELVYPTPFPDLKKAAPPDSFIIKDSGLRTQFSGGMVRDVAEDKIDYLLLRDGPMLKRWAMHLTRGAKKYTKRNWMLASGAEEKERFRESAARHFEQWLAGDRDEDHASAVLFNINGYEYCLEQEKKNELVGPS